MDIAVGTQSENLSINQAPAKPSALNPCQCEQCTYEEGGVIKQRGGFAHWYCDVCERGPFTRTQGQRPVYVRSVTVKGQVIGSRYACSGACATQEQMAKLVDAKRVAQQSGHSEGVKQIVAEEKEVKEKQVQLQKRGPGRPRKIVTNG